MDETQSKEARDKLLESSRTGNWGLSSTEVHLTGQEAEAQECGHWLEGTELGGAGGGGQGFPSPQVLWARVPSTAYSFSQRDLQP